MKRVSAGLPVCSRSSSWRQRRVCLDEQGLVLPRTESEPYLISLLGRIDRVHRFRQSRFHSGIVPVSVRSRGSKRESCLLPWIYLCFASRSTELKIAPVPMHRTGHRHPYSQPEQKVCSLHEQRESCPGKGLLGKGGCRRRNLA